MSKNNLFKLLFVSLFAFAATAFTGCSDDNDDVVAPVLTAQTTTLQFGAEDGAKTVSIEANCEWTVDASTLEGWAEVQPLNGSGNATLTVRPVGEITANKQGVIGFTLIHPQYGKWGQSETKITVVRYVGEAPGPDPVETEVIYNETFGSGECKNAEGKWLFLDQYTAYETTGTGAANVTYKGSGSSIRNSGLTSTGYEGCSGPNHVWLGSGSPYAMIQNIALNGKANLRLSMGASYGIKDDATGEYDNEWKDNTFHIYLGSSENSWTEITYDIVKGTNDTKWWGFITADFTLTAVPENLFIKISSDKPSAIKFDDVKLQTGIGGQSVSLEGGDTPTPPTPGGDEIATTFDFTAQGWANAQEITTLTQDGVTLTFETGGNPTTPKFYTSGNAVRLYAQNTMKITGSTLKKVELVFSDTDKQNGNDNEISTDVPTYAEPVWTGDAGELTFTIAPTKSDGKQGGHRRIAKVIVNGGSGDTPTPPTPGDAVTMTIPEIVAACEASGSEQTALNASADVVFEAVVVIDKTGGNTISNNLQLQTEGATAANNGILLYGSGVTNPKDENFAFAAGDKVRVTLKAGQARVTTYNGVHEVTGSKDTEWVAVEKIGTATITPVKITADKLTEYQSMAVTVENVTSPATAAVWCTADKGTTHKFKAGSAEMVVYVNGGATDFVDKSYKANATGAISGYVTLYKGVAQLAPRTIADVAAFMEGGEPQPAEPKVTTADYNTLTASSVVLGGSYADFASAPAEVGVEYVLFTSGTVDMLDWSKAEKVAAAAVATPFTVNVANLTAETQYAYRAYADNVYGEVKSFVTPASGQEETYDKISSITAAGTYTVKATVVGINKVSFMLHDDTGNILVYLGTVPEVAVGDVVVVSGDVEVRYDLPQFKKDATVTPVEKVAYTQPAPKAFTAAEIDAYDGNKNYDYVSVKGQLASTVSGSFTNFDITVDGTSHKVHIYRHVAEAEAELNALAGNAVVVTGYLVGSTKEGDPNIMPITWAADGSVTPGPVEPEPVDPPTPSGNSVELTLADITSVVGSFANQYNDATFTAADGSVWSGFVAGNDTRLQLGWKTNSATNAAKSYLLTPVLSGNATTVTVTPEAGTSNNRVVAALPIDFEYTGQTADEVKALAYGYTALTVQGSTEPLTIDLKGQNVKQFMIRAIAGAVYLTGVKIEHE